MSTTLTLENLRTLKQNDAVFADMVNNGRDVEAMAYAVANLPEVPAIGKKHTELGVLAAFADSTGNPTAGETCLQKIEAAASANPLVQRTIKWMKPGAEGVDFGNLAVQAMISSLAAAGVITTRERDVLLSLGRAPQSVTMQMIGEIR